MANERVFRIARLTDKQVVKLLTDLTSAFPECNSNITFGNGLSHTLANLPEDTLKARSHSITSAISTSQTPDFHLDFKRGVSRTAFTDRDPSSLADEIQIKINLQNNHPIRTHQPTSLPQYLHIIEIVEKNTKSLSSHSSTDELSNTSILHAELQKLSELASDLTIGADEKRRELDSRRDELDDAFRTKEAALEVAFQQKESVLESKTAELEAIKKELDDREHKHVRRELRETITLDIQKQIHRPQRSGSASNLMLVSMTLALIGAAALGYMAYLTQNAISAESIRLSAKETEGLSAEISNAAGASFYLLYLKVLLSSAGSVGFLLYVISWLRNLASEEINYRRKLEQYVFDMNRASWTIETMLELSDSELDEVPQSWLDSVTNNLFENGSSKNEDTSSLQALAALLNVTTEAEIGPDGPKFKLNRRGAKKAASDAQ